MRKRYSIAAEDVFYFAIITAYLSTRPYIWKGTSPDGSDGFLMLILGIVCCAIIIPWIRHSVYAAIGPNQNKHGRLWLISAPVVAALALLLVIVLYFQWKNTNLLTPEDKHIITTTAILWVSGPIIEILLDKVVLFVSLKQQNRIRADNNKVNL